jgi:hypothetical protein
LDELHVTIPKDSRRGFSSLPIGSLITAKPSPLNKHAGFAGSISIEDLLADTSRLNEYAFALDDPQNRYDFF